MHVPVPKRVQVSDLLGLGRDLLGPLPGFIAYVLPGVKAHRPPIKVRRLSRSVGDLEPASRSETVFWAAGWTSSHSGLDRCLQFPFNSWSAMPGEMDRADSDPHASLLASELNGLYLLEQERQSTRQPEQMAAWQDRQQQQPSAQASRSPFLEEGLQSQSITGRNNLLAAAAAADPMRLEACHAPNDTPAQPVDQPLPSWPAQFAPLDQKAALTSPSSTASHSQHSSPPAPISPSPSSRLAIHSPATPIRQPYPLHSVHASLGATSKPCLLASSESFTPASRLPSFSNSLRPGPPGPAEAHQPRQLAQQASSPAQSAQVGWGGQAIPDSPGFRVPWFGRNRGKGLPTARGARGTRGRSRGAMSPSLSLGGRRGARRAGPNGSNVATRSALDSQYGGYGIDQQGMSIDEVVHLVQNLSPKQRIPDAAFSALFHFDSRATALLLKELSKAGMGARASELFQWLRALEPGHPLQVILAAFCRPAQSIDNVLCTGTCYSYAAITYVRIWHHIHGHTRPDHVSIICGRVSIKL